MKLADAHMHLFPAGYARPGHGSLFGPREFDAYCVLRASHNIERSLAIGYEADGIDPQNNAYLRGLAAEHDWLYSVAYVDPLANPEAETIARLMRDGHSGLAVYVPDLARAEALRGWRPAVWDVLRRRKALVSFNAVPAPIAALAPLVRDLPEISFVFSHLGLPGRLAPDISDAQLRVRLSPLLSLAGLPNAFVKISGLYATSEPAHAYPHRAGGRALGIVLDAFKADHCLWASDFAPALDFVSFSQTIDFDGLELLAAPDRENVVRGNLIRMLDNVVRVG
jgi:predicted TIM-barrel fold metal-dependent hydrolase